MKDTNTPIYLEIKARYGALNEIANEANVSREWVRNVLQGKAQNSEILTIAAKVLRRHKQKERKALKEVAEALAE